MFKCKICGKKVKEIPIYKENECPGSYSGHEFVKVEAD